MNDLATRLIPIPTLTFSRENYSDISDQVAYSPLWEWMEPRVLNVNQHVQIFVPVSFEYSRAVLKVFQHTRIAKIIYMRSTLSQANGLLVASNSRYILRECNFSSTEIACRIYCG